MLIFADMVVVTKGDIVSPAEREVFAFRVRKANRKAPVLFVNGLTGQGAFELARQVKNAPETLSLEHGKIRFPLPVQEKAGCLRI
jgi:Ni2+-binding GTPase involved in maturation of urease and hydrogenase